MSERLRDGAGRADQDGTTAQAPVATTGAATGPRVRVGRATAVMASGTLVSRVLGLVSKIVLTALLGLSAANLAANAFDVANKLPNLIYAIVAGGALNAVLVPQIVRADRDGARGREFLDRLFTMALVGLLGLTVVLTLLARPLVALYTDGWAQPEFDLAVAFALWCVPQVFFYGAYTLFGQVLNARGSFGPYMWAPVVNNVVAITGMLVFLLAFGRQQTTDPAAWTPGMVALLAGTATLGVAGQAAVLAWPLRRIGFTLRPRWGLRGVGFRSAGRVAAWTFAGIVVSQLVFVLVSNTASRTVAVTRGTDLAETTASTTAWTLGFLLYMLPHSLIAVSVVTAVFTQVSGAAAHADTAGVAAGTRRYMRLLLVAVALPAAGLVAFGDLVSAVLFAPDDAPPVVVGRVVAAMALGLPFFSVLYLVRRVFYAYEDGRTPFWVTLVTAGVWAAGTAAVPFLLPVQWWVAGIAASMSLGEVAGLVVATAWLHRRVGDLGVRGFLWVLARIGVVLAVVVPAAVLVGRLAGGTGSRPEALLGLLAGGAVLVVGYVAGTLLLRVRETRAVADLLAARLLRRGGARGRV
ncbi:murein biosynthesis integral membrane protein MurJ [Aquipuribacter nitratireducens]|uniref:Murein biosynthesis integral membrane protein MurJ n=1 Tax=Aquipuribacter nitratireducens TaxID=650104 RepID=A0ABW0GSQ4_9MICO